jgi:hypothetical protein
MSPQGILYAHNSKKGIIIEVKEIKWHDMKMCNYSHPFKRTSTQAPGRIKGCENKSQQANYFDKLFKPRVH